MQSFGKKGERHNKICLYNRLKELIKNWNMNPHVHSVQSGTFVSVFPKNINKKKIRLCITLKIILYTFTDQLASQVFSMLGKSFYKKLKRTHNQLATLPTYYQDRWVRRISCSRMGNIMMLLMMMIIILLYIFYISCCCMFVCA